VQAKDVNKSWMHLGYSRTLPITLSVHTN
jgi:hypothetical protein